MVFLFNVMAQDSQCKRTKKGKSALSLETSAKHKTLKQNFKNKVQFCTEGKKPEPP